MTRSAASKSLSNYRQKCATVFYVSPTDPCADYTTIQAALTANATQGIMVIVMPGTYTNDTINFTANRQTVTTWGKGNNVIVTNSSQVVECGDYIGCKVQNLRINFTPTTAINGIEVNNGEMSMNSCRLDLTTSTDIAGATQPALIATTGTGTLTTKEGEFTYQHTGDTGTGLKAMLSISNGSTIEILRSCDFSMTNSGTATATTAFVDTGTGKIRVEEACIISITDTDATIVVGFGYLGGSGDNQITHSSLEVTGGGANDCYAVYHGGTGTFRSSHNNVLISGGANNYGIYVGAGATFIGHMDDIRAADGNQIVGTASVASSEADGQFTVSGIATLGDGSTLASAAAPTADAEIANKKYVDDNAGGGTPNLFYAYKTSQQVLTGAYAAITGWAATTYDDGAYTFNTTTGILTINTTGIYLVGYGVMFNLETGTRMHAVARLEQDPLGGGSYAEVPGTGTSGYGRTVNQGTHGSSLVPIALTATDLLRVTAYEYSAGGEINSTSNNGTNFWAYKIG